MLVALGRRMMEEGPQWVHVQCWSLKVFSASVSSLGAQLSSKERNKKTRVSLLYGESPGASNFPHSKQQLDNRKNISTVTAHLQQASVS